MNQMPLDFGEAKHGRGRPSKRHSTGHGLFFAICPPDAVEQQAASIADDYRKAFSLSGKPRLTTLHVTITSVGEYKQLPEDIVFAARRAAATAESAPIAIDFDHIMSFRQSEALVVYGEGGLKALTRLHVQLGISMHNLGLPHNIKRNFTPHMTLLYDPKIVPTAALNKPVSWTASEFLLIESLLGETEHRIVDRWPLLG
ncbi:2'-5' RNA ligase family protein [Rhizobium sp. L43]|uniref:2'-5' RNA ligase family protein n=1 Tax=Rhizobium sp. L43 TaxID=2035452 RepID=UPI000BE9AC78|nr:2'-5' RNA ligase family protein [Rhizobium sp. L43]PDS80703.1 2'-5' RNA ligase [Rhizobium sp. L43]